MTDPQCIEWIKEGGKRREKAANHLFAQYKGLIVYGTQKHKINRDEAFDAYSDAILALVRHVANGDFKGESKLSTYLNGIFFRKCVDQIRKKTTHWEDDTVLNNLEDESPNPAHLLETASEMKKLKGLMGRLSNNCQRILMLRYYWGYDNMEEIAEKLGLKNANTAGSLRHRCMKQLMHIVNENEKNSYGDT
jgi:RNA polymerase sigma factor (sigma-70 family)